MAIGQTLSRSYTGSAALVLETMVRSVFEFLDGGNCAAWLGRGDNGGQSSAFYLAIHGGRRANLLLDDSLDTITYLAFSASIA